MFKNNQESSGTLELQNMLKGPNLALLAQQSTNLTDGNPAADKSSKTAEEPKKLKTKRSPK